MIINTEGLNLIKHFESFKPNAYQDSVGVWTIGWGHTGSKKGDAPVEEGLVITEEEALELLQGDLVSFEDSVERYVDVPINENQFSALVSFTFNLGAGNLKSSTLLRLLNEGDHFGASREFKKWSKAGGKRLAGLVRRRISERNLFSSFADPVVTQLRDDWESVLDDM